MSLHIKKSLFPRFLSENHLKITCVRQGLFKHFLKIFSFISPTDLSVSVQLFFILLLSDYSEIIFTFPLLMQIMLPLSSSFVPALHVASYLAIWKSLSPSISLQSTFVCKVDYETFESKVLYLDILNCIALNCSQRELYSWQYSKIDLYFRKEKWARLGEIGFFLVGVTTLFIAS